MRIVALEYITGGGLEGEPLDPAMQREGRMMLGALVAELAAIPGVEVTCTQDPRLEKPRLRANFVPADKSESIWDLWSRIIPDSDAVWPIAPETGGVLERLSHMARESGRLLLGSSPSAVHVAGSKHATAEILAMLDIPVVSTQPASAPLRPSDSGWVAKPDDGVDAGDTWFFAQKRELASFLAGRDDQDRFVVQPFVPGFSASISALFRDGEAEVLSCNSQNVIHDGKRFSYRGGVVGDFEAARPDFERIAKGVAKALPGLFGYAGIDIIVTEHGPVVLEVNPRLTTSYVGLGEALGCNVAALVLDLAAGKPLPKLRPPKKVQVRVQAV